MLPLRIDYENHSLFVAFRRKKTHTLHLFQYYNDRNGCKQGVTLKAMLCSREYEGNIHIPKPKLWNRESNTVDTIFWQRMTWCKKHNPLVHKERIQNDAPKTSHTYTAPKTYRHEDIRAPNSWTCYTLMGYGFTSLVASKIAKHERKTQHPSDILFVLPGNWKLRVQVCYHPFLYLRRRPVGHSCLEAHPAVRGSPLVHISSLYLWKILWRKF